MKWRPDNYEQLREEAGPIVPWLHFDKGFDTGVEALLAEIDKFYLNYQLKYLATWNPSIPILSYSQFIREKLEVK